MNVNVSALTTPFGAPAMLAKSNANVPNWLMFFPAKNCLNDKPVNPNMSALPATFGTLAAVSPETPLNATSPPGSLIEKPGFIVMVTLT